MASQDDYSFEEDPLFASLSPEQLKALSTRLNKERRDRVQAEESARVAQESARKARENVLVAQESARKARENARLAQESARQAREDAAAVSSALEAERAEQAELDAGHTVDQYISRVFRLNFHLPRLLPKKTVVEKAKAETEPPSHQTSTTTTGRTSIMGKYYPLKLVLWNECDSVLAEAYETIRSKLGNQLLFPSARQMGFMEGNLLEDLPQEFANSPVYLTELKTSYFLHEVLEKPASRILNAYLSRHKVFFDNKNAGAHVRYITRDIMQDQDDGDEQTEVQTPDQLEEPSEEQGATVAAVPLPKVPVKVQADCIILCTRVAAVRQTVGVDHGHAEEEVDTGEDDAMKEDIPGAGGEEDAEEPDPTVFRIAFGEHKPAHRLRAPIVRRLVENGISSDYMLQMARLKAIGRPSEDAKKVVPGSAPGQVYFTYALTQTYHYMISAGILYGYVASGDTLTFLRIDREDPTTLLYWPVIFPEYAKGLDEMGSERVAGMLADTPNLPVARLCSVVLKAWETGTEDHRWRAAAYSNLATFPNLPSGLAESFMSSPRLDEQSSPSSSASQPPKRGFSDFEDDDDGNDDGNGGGQSRSNPSQHLSVDIPNRPRNPSPLQHHNLATFQQSWNTPFFGLRDPVFLKPSRFDPISFRPIRPYCTQACLLGLVRGLPLDDQCPNVLLHQRAAQHARSGAMTVDDILSTQPGKVFHAIRSVEELERLLVLQLYGNIMQDCQCLLEEGFAGLIGCLFRLTLTGYGYTFVAKGVQMFDRKKLRREAAVYAHLAEHQGRLVPVYLGTIKLLLPYGRDDSVVVSHMMLMSYAGPALFSEAIEQRQEQDGDLASMDLHEEADRTWKDLQALGVQDDDEDNMDSNFTWCDEAKRAMRVDFHCARAIPDNAGLRKQLIHGNKKPHTVSIASTLTRASSPMSNLSLHGKLPTADADEEGIGRPHKRIKV